MRIRKSFALVVSVAVVTATVAYGQLGLGTIVYDPTNFGKLAEQLTQMEQQYSQLVQTYAKVNAQYNQMLFMAQMVPGGRMGSYRALITPWSNSTATNTYGTTGGWIVAINKGSGVSGGYQQAIHPMGAYGDALSNVPADQVARVKTSYATVELADGANQNGIDLLGRVRANSPQVERAIQGLEDDSLSSDPNLNTEVSVLNKINAANLVSVRNTQDTNKLLVALTEQQIIEAKRKRDAEAAAINSHIRFMAEEQSVLNAQKGDPSARMMAYRMP